MKSSSHPTLHQVLEDQQNIDRTNQKNGPATGLWRGCLCVALAEVRGGEVPVNRVMGTMGDLLENFREPIGRMQRERVTYPPKIGYPTRKFHLPTIHFQGLC